MCTGWQLVDFGLAMEANGTNSLQVALRRRDYRTACAGPRVRGLFKAQSIVMWEKADDLEMLAFARYEKWSKDLFDS